MAAITPLGGKIRRFRAARGCTQLELSLAAGVSERTVRNAEKSVPLRRDFLQFIAEALGVSIEELVESDAALGIRCWEDKIARVMTAVQKTMHDQDPSAMFDVIHPSVEVDFQGGLPDVPTAEILLGRFQGAEGLKRLVELAGAFWEQCPHARTIVEPPAGGGDVLIVRACHEHPRQDGSLAWARWSFILEFEGDRIIRIENFFAPCAAPLDFALKRGRSR